MLPRTAGVPARGVPAPDPDNDGVTIEALVFDFDGLLMDTESSALASWQHEWRQHGLELDRSTFFADHGGDVTEERYAALARAVGPTYAREPSHARRLAHRDRLNTGLGLSPGIASWLDRARELRLRLAVASSSPREWVRALLAGAGYLDRFELMACGDEVAQPKPDPGVYLLALQRMDLPAARAIAIEDSPHGVAAAQGAGMRCVAIPNSHTSPARFATADLLLTSAAQIGLDEALRPFGGSAALA
jgi:HAD superfamily hydrolase (TIGR01509 family)